MSQFFLRTQAALPETQEVITLTSNATLEQALQVVWFCRLSWFSNMIPLIMDMQTLSEHNILSAPVISESKGPLGVIDILDIVAFVVQETLEDDGKPILFSATKVSDIIGTPLAFVINLRFFTSHNWKIE